MRRRFGRGRRRFGGGRRRFGRGRFKRRMRLRSPRIRIGYRM